MRCERMAYCDLGLNKHILWKRFSKTRMFTKTRHIKQWRGLLLVVNCSLVKIYRCVYALQGDVMLALFYVHNTSGRVGNVLIFEMLLPARWAKAKENTYS